MREPGFTPIDPGTWKRGQVFYYFSKMAPTGYSLTVELDITAMKAALDRAGMKFYPAYLWLVTKNLSGRPEFCMAEKEGQIGYYDGLTPLYAVFHPEDETFSLMWTEYRASFPEFHADYLRDQWQYGETRGILAKPGLPPPNAYTVSCLPWVSFQHFAVHSYDSKPYYFPSVEAGKFYEKEGRLLLPLSITCHHAAADGIHVSRFLQQLQQDADAMAQYL